MEDNVDKIFNIRFNKEDNSIESVNMVFTSNKPLTVDEQYLIGVLDIIGENLGLVNKMAAECDFGLGKEINSAMQSVMTAINKLQRIKDETDELQTE